MNETSRELVERASGGDGPAVDRLIELHLPGLRRFVHNRVGGLVQARETASDVVQSACREVLEHMDRFRYDGEEGFKRWLYRTALRKIQDRQRYYLAEKRDIGREVPISTGGQSSQGGGGRRERFFHSLSQATPSEIAGAKEEIERVEALFGDLPDNYRRIIQLAHFEGKSHAEIAAEFKITETNSRVLLSRALARLARLVREAQGGEQESR